MACAVWFRWPQQLGWSGYSHFMLIIILYTGIPITASVRCALCYLLQAERAVDTFFCIYRTHCQAFYQVRGAAIDPTFLLPKRSYDLLLWGIHALKATSKDYSQQS